MKRVSIRGTTLGMLIFSSFLYALIVGFSVISFWALTTLTIPSGVSIFVALLIIVFLFLPGTLYCFGTIVSYLKQIQFTQDTLIFTHPFKKKQEIPRSDISHWGCAAFVPRSTVMYFCTADTDTLLHHLEANRKLCLHIFGETRVASLESCSDGLLRLAVGTYLYHCLHHPQNNVIILRYCTPDRLKKVATELKRDALITGPWLIDTLSAWESSAKYQL